MRAYWLGGEIGEPRPPPGAASCPLFHTADIEDSFAPAHLARALDEVVRRHSILRTTFAAPGGIPEPVVSPAAPRPLPLVDLAGLPEPSWKTELARLSTEERRRPFDLAAGRMTVPSSPAETAVG